MAVQSALNALAHYFRKALSRFPPKFQWIVKGCLSYIPGIFMFVDKTRSESARYCYSVWMRHLVVSWECGGLRKFPEVLLELGPGSSFGVGLAAMLTGTNKYYALDTLQHADLQENLETFDELVRLFSERAAIPHGTEFTTEVRPPLKNYDFPYHILDDQYLSECLNLDRLKMIREALEISLKESENTSHCPIQICYVGPWIDEKIIPDGSVDMVISNTTLEHVDNLDEIVDRFYDCLVDGGFMSHNIDFSDHGCSNKWNGHWAISPLVWSIMRGRRPYLINREPYSTYSNLFESKGFKIVCDIKFQNQTGITREELTREFENLSEDDFHTTGAILQAVK